MNRREVTVSLTEAGRRLVEEVTARRRIEIGSIMSRVPISQRATVVEALTAFRDAVGDDPSIQTISW